MMALVLRSRLLDSEVLSQNASVVFVLDSELKIAGCNESWDRFARQNGGEGVLACTQLSRSIFDCIPESLTEFYKHLYARARLSGKPIDHEYDCSSPEKLRRFRMRLLPLADSGEIVVVNSLIVQGPHPRQAIPGGPQYVHADGSIVMCAHCRCTRQVGSDRWDWIPSYVEEMPLVVSHGLCEVCFAYHYPDQWQRRHQDTALS
jgi:hypothetical protein